MSKQRYTTIGELLNWSYANLAMAHVAVDSGCSKYQRLHYMIRAKLYKGLNDGTVAMRSLYDDERGKLKLGPICNYCGASGSLSVDHIVPRARGGTDDAENLVAACPGCNSSKGAKDLMDWMQWRGSFLPLLVIRRYLKLTYASTRATGELSTSLLDSVAHELPFAVTNIPTQYRLEDGLVLTAAKLHNT